MVMLEVKRKGGFVIFRKLGGSKSQYIVKTRTKDLTTKQIIVCEMRNTRWWNLEEQDSGNLVNGLLLRFNASTRVVVSFSHYVKQSLLRKIIFGIW